MMTQTRLAEILVGLLFAAIIAVVFQQIATDMEAQNIASGGPYSDAASYPRTLAIAMGLALIANTGLRYFRRTGPSTPKETTGGSRRPAALLGLFALYLVGLDRLGYLFASIALIILVMLLCGERRLWLIVSVAIGVTFVLSAIFGGLLNVVLPRGDYGLALPW